MKLKSGCHYWCRDKFPGYTGVWKIAYVGQDPDDNLWFHMLGVQQAIEVSQMKLDRFEFKKIKKPKE